MVTIKHNKLRNLERIVSEKSSKTFKLCIDYELGKIILTLLEPVKNCNIIHLLIMEHNPENISNLSRLTKMKNIEVMEDCTILSCAVLTLLGNIGLRLL